ncbi:MAG: S41 family peptidase [Alphaproteobacteria bacterium]|nr:MAG: S41 family peptidase [Alphaproteobacteria bacterium]
MCSRSGGHAMIDRSALLIGTVLAAGGVACAQAPEPQIVGRHGPPGGEVPRPALPDTEENRRTIVGALADALERNYVFPDVALRYAQALRTKAAAGGYADLGDRFGETVTADLQAIHADRHVRFGPTGGPDAAGPGPRRVMMAPGAAGAPPPGPGGPAPRRVMRRPDASSAIGQSGWIADGVAYIDIGLFPGTPETVERFRAFLEAHKDARAIIFDIRGHHGGGLADMDAIFSYIYPRETLLLGMDTRTAAERQGGNPMGESGTIRRASAPDGISRTMHYAIPGPDTPLRRAQVFLLTSRRSGSAAEHFALALKRTHRATLIGETTAGAGHYGRMVDFGGYAAFVPVGRTFDPDNNWDWEGVGVSPDVPVPADQALDEALRRLGVTPEQRRPLT